jgi:serine protease Do
LRVDGKDVTPEQSLSFIVANIEPGRRINLEIVRDGERQTLPVTVGRRPSDEELAAQVFNPDEESAESPFGRPTPGGLIQEALGVAVIPLTPQIAGQLGMPSATTGVVVTDVDPNADAARKGFNRGTVILGANNRSIASTDDLEAAVRAAQAEQRTALLLRIRVRGQPEFSVPVRLR